MDQVIVFNADAHQVLHRVSLRHAVAMLYREVARVRFALLKLAEVHGTEAVEAEFRLAATPPRVIRA